MGENLNIAKPLESMSKKLVSGTVRKAKGFMKVAEDLYGSPQFDWVVLTTAGILNVRNEWPLSNRDLYVYANDKYGESLNSVMFHETKEVKDSSGRLILPKGKVVDSNFTIPKPGTPTATLNPVVGISNFEYETRLNDKKRNIFVITEEY